MMNLYLYTNLLTGFYIQPPLPSLFLYLDPPKILIQTVVGALHPYFARVGGGNTKKSGKSGSHRFRSPN